MAFLVADKLVFLHVPKAAGTWVRIVLPKAGVKLTGTLKETHWTGVPPRDRRAFTFVRHPANWLKSMWMQMERAGVGIEKPPANLALFEKRFKKGMPFSEYVEFLLVEDPQAISRMFDEYEQPCWMVGRVEDLPESLCHILEAADLKFKKNVIENWHRENVTDHGLRERTRFAPYQRERLLEAEAEFCKKWGYR